MRRLTATLVVGGMLVFGMAPAGADPDPESNPSCIGREVTVSVAGQQKRGTVLKNAAGKTESILDEPEPFVLQNGLGDFAVQYKLVAFTEDAKTAVRTVSELRQHALDEFNDAGVEIMTPMIHAVRNSADLTTPTSAAQPDSPPTFQVRSS